MSSLLVLAALAADPAPLEPAVRWVGADVARVRVSPSIEADIAGRLRIATPVEVVEVRGEWTHVRFEGARPPVVEGWVQGRRLAEAPPSEAALVDELEAADDDIDRARVRERLDALRGVPPVDGVHLALCRTRDGARRAELLGRWSASLGLGPVFDGVDAGRGLVASAPTLGARAWHVLGFRAAATERLGSTPFPRPFATWSAERGASAVAPGEPVDEDEDGVDLVVLGPCAADESLLSTAPLRRATLEPVSAARLGELAVLAAKTGPVLGLAARRVVGVDVELLYVDRPYAHDPHRCPDCEDQITALTVLVDGATRFRTAEQDWPIGVVGTGEWVIDPASGHLLGVLGTQAYDAVAALFVDVDPIAGRVRHAAVELEAPPLDLDGQRP